MMTEKYTTRSTADGFAIAVAITLAATACGSNSTTKRAKALAEVTDIRKAVLVQPTAFDLQIPEDFFTRDGRGLPDSPATVSCHTQGLTIAGDELFISCVMFDRNYGDDVDARTSTGRSYVLHAPLCQITGCESVDGKASDKPAATIDWKLHELTEKIPTNESYRITQAIRKRPLTDEDRKVRRLMSHPSGLEYDPQKRGVWLANSTYAPDTYAHMFLLDPENIGGDGPVRNYVSVRSHIGAVMLVDDRYLLGWSWASRNLIVAELSGSGKSIMTPHPRLDTDDHIDIQDCNRWSGTLVLCSGVHSYEASPDAPDVPLDGDKLTDAKRDTIRIREGRIQILDVDVTEFPSVVVKVVGTLRAKLSDKAEASETIGVEKYRQGADGKRKSMAENDYAGYQSAHALPYEGMAVSADHKYIFFLPDDVPGGQLIRMRLTQ